MAQFEVVMPKMGESIEEATITKWFVKEGDKVVEDDVLLEIATDKVDSEIPSPVEGVVKKVLFDQDETVAVGTVIAVIDMDADGADSGSGEVSAAESSGEEGAAGKGTEENNAEKDQASEKTGDAAGKEPAAVAAAAGTSAKQEITAKSGSGRFYSPLVRKIANEEQISQEELDSIEGSGLNGRVQKNDILAYLKSRSSGKEKPGTAQPEPSGKTPAQPKPAPEVKVSVSSGEGDEVIEMSRMRKLIAAHMIHSKQTSAHVTNMLEIDVTNVVNWRNKVKDEFLKKEGQKLTYLPVFMEATVKALRDYPMINASVDGEKIIVRKNINLGIAVSLEDNNLIVPNIKRADQLNLNGLTTSLNKIASAARSNKLSPDDISGGTFTITNFGTSKNDIGTPIINQPEVAILAIGAIKKKPAVLETPEGDVIAIRHKMWLSLTYDHRIIDGALGGAFLRTLGDYIENFDVKRTI
jgi:2-oxoglutarate dehydrogenase E2 component (dihydrolipoamide succinyltransferase)